MTDTIIKPKELGDVFDRALDKCFEMLRAGENDHIAFLIIMDNKGIISDQRIAIEVTEDYFEPVTNELFEDADEIRIYALAVVGHLLIDRREKPAILIEAGEQGNDESMVLAHRITTGFLGLTKPRPLGRLELVDMRKSRI